MAFEVCPVLFFTLWMGPEKQGVQRKETGMKSLNNLDDNIFSAYYPVTMDWGLGRVS